MRPVPQEVITHDPDAGVYGDCFRACLASLLEISIRDTPHFCEGVAPSDTAWVRDLNRWLFAVFGLGWLETLYLKPDYFLEAGMDTFHILSGPSPRYPGVLHSVVARNGVMVHDPHPSGEGLSGEPDSWTCGFLIATQRT